MVFDTTLPRHLATLGGPYMEMLRVLFGRRAVIPRAVEMELRQAARLGHAPSARALIGQRGILRTIPLVHGQTERALRLREDLPAKSGAHSENLGEAEAIILAQDLAVQGASVLVIDDRDGAIAAVGRGINTLGSVWVMALAAVEGIRSDDDAWDIYGRLVGTGMGVPGTGWRHDRDGHARFQTAITKWRAAVARSSI